MSCYHPLVAIKKFDEYTGKNKIKILGSLTDENHQPVTYDEWLKKCDVNPETEKILLPCGNCVGCRLEYSRQWAVRCMLEAQEHKHNYFLTLTYDDEHLKRYCYRENFDIVADTGECRIFNSVSLNSGHFTKFMKDLREYFRANYGETDIRFYGCGEYGDKKGRPHFHIILFNCNIRDLVYDRSINGFPYYTSETINNIWKCGIVAISEVTFDSCAYVARYVMKKVKGKGSEYYKEQGQEPPFVRMSRRPGIARNYFDDNSEKIYKYDNITLPGGYGKVVEIQPPRYFDTLYEVEHPDELRTIKDSRMSRSINAEELRKKNTSVKDKFDYLQVLEGNKLDSMSRLPRNFEG